MAISKKIVAGINNPHLFRLISLVINVLFIVPSALYITNYPMKIAFVWGIYLIAKDFFFERRMFTARFWPILFFFGVGFAFSVFLNFPYQFPDTAINWVYAMQAVFLVYPFSFSEGKENQMWMKRFNDCFIGLIFILGALSLILYAFSIHYWVLDGTQTYWQRQGFIENRLFGLYTSPNLGSALGAVSVAASLVNNVLKRGNWRHFQKLYVANAIVQYLYFILASSRGTTLALIAAGILFLLYRGGQLLQSASPAHFGKRIGKTILVIFLVVSVNGSVAKVLSYVPIVNQGLYLLATDANFREEFLSAERQKNGKKLSDVIAAPVKIHHDDGNEEVSAGRLGIWKSGLKAMKQRPLFGLADADLYRRMKPDEVTDQVNMSQLSTSERASLKRAMGNMHSSYVALLVKTGGIGFLLMGGFMVTYLLSHLKNLFFKDWNGDKDQKTLTAILLITLMSLLVLDLVENHFILSNRDPIGWVFWTYAGFLNVVAYKQGFSNPCCPKWAVEKFRFHKK